MLKPVLVTAVMLLAACTSTETGQPLRSGQITPPVPAPGPKEHCKEVLFRDQDRCVGWTAPEPHRFSEIFGLHSRASRIAAEWVPYYICAAITDDVAKAALGSPEFVRLVIKPHCNIVVPGHERTGIYNSLEISITEHEPGNPYADWFAEPNPLGENLTVNGRKAVRNTRLSNDTSERIKYFIETSDHTAVWQIELDHSIINYKSTTPFTASVEDADRRAHIVIDALTAYDEA